MAENYLYTETGDSTNEIIIKRMNDINTFSCTDNEITLRGTDENGEEFIIVFSATDLLEWIDIKYIKEQTIKYIKKL
tara:strand:+ start:12907 stop:13137 length:231 start_codon:yes stop_codon:yes gene_type:complete